MGAEPLILLAIGAGSVLLVGALVFGARRLGIFGGERTVESTDEDLDAFGARATVAVRLSESETGRIQFRGTSWPARTVRGAVEVGSEVRIVDRDNLVWIVEPVGAQLPKGK